MSHYTSMYCERHGDWEMDVDNPSECPECERLGMTEVQTLRAALAASEAKRAELEGLLRRVGSAANAYAIACGHGRADMAPLDKRLRDDITTAMRGKEASDA